ncbi:class I SAM-dependent DNA methyltransferase [uncultured Psychrobacter sp.]|uniref:type I restriction-modification system subunit M n=1 Tax=uncultured Psychrobacter sp. TaxID=259303 RepID=UPI002615C6D5|nr:class I SAM-dependent DNA methyltransferase [uncultured Psychrobacter sp.]
MAKTPATKNDKSFEESLWDAANKLRGSVESSEYKHIVLSLIFLKFISDTFEQQRQKLIDTGYEKHIDMVQAYTKDNVFYLPEESRWSFIQQNAKQEDIALKIDTALSTIEKTNQSLKGALPDNYFSRLDLTVSKLAALIDVVNNINTLADSHEDIVGRVYEYFLSKFAIAEGKGKGEFYTPKSIVNLIAELIEPYKGKIYDPCCGSGGMFVQSMKFIESHKGNTKDVSVYGQEYTGTTYKLAKMNLAIRGITANLGSKDKNTFTDDQHPTLKADFIMANPPYNQKNWRESDELVDDYRWEGYETPPESNANYAWILHMVSKLSVNGVAGFILSNGVLSSGSTEYKIRKQLIENDLVEAIIVCPMNMFYTTDTSVSLWIVNKNKRYQEVIHNNTTTYRDRKGEVLFIDARNFGSVYDKKYIKFDAEEDIKKISSIFKSWRCHKSTVVYNDVVELCYSASYDEIRKKDYTLVPSKYIQFSDDEKFEHLDDDLDELKDQILRKLLLDMEVNKSLLSIIQEES